MKRVSSAPEARPGIFRRSTWAPAGFRNQQVRAVGRDRGGESED